MHLHVIQDIATPHNNVLLAALKKKPGTQLTLWYCQSNPQQYAWQTDYANAVQPARMYRPHGIDWRLLAAVLFHPADKILLVGWMNPTTKLLLALLWLTRRRFTFWLDVPNDNAPRSAAKEKLRRLFLKLLATSNSRVFCVGKHTVAYFQKLGVAPNRLVNFPFVVQVKPLTAPQKAAVRKKYGVQGSKLLFSCGSRLVRDKGFDIVVAALAKLTPAQRQKLTCVIVGKGPEQQALHQQAQKAGLKKTVIFKDWMEITEFEKLIAASHAFIHPARFDAYGNTMYALPLGVPVLGSTGAGAAVDMLTHGQNGWLFNPDQPQTLTALIQNILAKPALLQPLARHAQKSAASWTPALAANAFWKNLY